MDSIWEMADFDQLPIIYRSSLLKVHYFDVQYVGLSRSRNLGLQCCSCLLLLLLFVVVLLLLF